MNKLIISLLIVLLLTTQVGADEKKEKETKEKPAVIFSTYYGGAGTDDCDAIAVDLVGNSYLGCHSNTLRLPGGSEQAYKFGGKMDAFVVKLNKQGNKVNYLTHLRGSKWEAVQGLATDSAGNLYAVGTTYSHDFPVSAGAFQTTFGGKSDAFVVKLNPDGKVAWSTFLGGSADEDGRDISIDQQGRVHIVGRTKSSNFPTKNALQIQSGGGIDVFFATLDADGKMIAASYLGGIGDDIGAAIKLDKTGRRYLSGTTDSSDFPVKNALQAKHQGDDDLFVAVINEAGSILEFASYLGGSGTDKGYDIGLMPSGDLLVMGGTKSENFPTTEGAFQKILSGESDIFVARVNLQEPHLVYSTFVGGEKGEEPKRLVVDHNGRGYVVGKTASHNFPTTNGLQIKLQGRADAFVTVLDPTGTSLAYSNLFGGGGLDVFEDVAIGADTTLTMSGLSNSTNFPLLNPLQSTFKGGRFDIIVTRITIPY